MRNYLGWIIVAAVVAAAGTRVEGQQPTQPAGNTFTWGGELVAIDAAARTFTVKSRIAYPEALSELKQFMANDPVWIVWSGVSTSSDAIRQIRRPKANHKITDTMVMAAELVSPEVTNQYVTLRVKVPESALAAIKSVKPGEWVTVTSRQQSVTEGDAVVAVRPYNEHPTGAPTVLK